MASKLKFTDEAFAAFRKASPVMHAKLNASPVGKMPGPNTQAGKNLASYERSMNKHPGTRNKRNG